MRVPQIGFRIQSIEFRRVERLITSVGPKTLTSGRTLWKKGSELVVCFFALRIRESLGTRSNYEELPWQQEAGPSEVSPFPEGTDYLGDSKQVTFGSGILRLWWPNFGSRALPST